jgi:acyl-CoA reductase-like NAD-dependent aldehyde dehydrogenase
MKLLLLQRSRQVCPSSFLLLFSFSSPGKALRTESRVEAGVLADTFTFFGGLGGELKGMTIPWSPTSMTYTVHEPLGVCGVIIPWNAPLMLMSLKIAPAIVAGNTVVVKSAEEAPLGVLRVCEIMNSVLPKVSRKEYLLFPSDSKKTRV